MPDWLSALHRRRGIRLRMTALTTGILVAVLVLAGAVFLQALRVTLRDTAVQSARAHLAELADSVGAGTTTPPTARRAEVLVEVVSADGRVLASSPARAPTLRLPRLSPGTQATYDRHTVPTAEPGNDYRVLARGVATPQSAVTVYAAVSVDDATEGADQARTLALIALPVLAIPIGLLTWFTVGRTLAPIERMRRAADGISGRAPSQRVVVPDRDDEVARLGRTLNAMLDRLEVAQRAQQQFVADAAHELRSPVSVIRAQLDAHGPDRYVEDWTRLHADLTAETARMQRLVEGMLLLARADLSSLRPRVRAVDVDDLVVVAARRTRARTGVDVDLSEVRPVQSRLDPDLIDQALDNVLDNAARHARSRIAVGVAELDGGVQITVDDDGAGIPPEQREHVFQRFTRLDEARARVEGGVGLGLAIVRDVVRAHGGSVTVTEAPLGGARIRIAFGDSPPSSASQ